MNPMAPLENFRLTVFRKVAEQLSFRKAAEALYLTQPAVSLQSKARVQWPWFILFFCLAAVANTYLHLLQPAYPVLKQLGVLGLAVTLYLIGTGLSAQTVRQVGPRPLLQEIILWIAVACGSLALIRVGWIHL